MYPSTDIVKPFDKKFQNSQSPGNCGRAKQGESTPPTGLVAVRREWNVRIGKRTCSMS